MNNIIDLIQSIFASFSILVFVPVKLVYMAMLTRRAFESNPHN